MVNTFIKFWKFFQATRLIGPPRLFDFGHFFPTYTLLEPRAY